MHSFIAAASLSAAFQARHFGHASPRRFDASTPVNMRLFIDDTASKQLWLSKLSASSWSSHPPSHYYDVWLQQLEQACPVHYLCVSDVTDGHAVEGVKSGRALRADGLDIKVLIVSSHFHNQSRLARQKIINAVLSEYVQSGVLHSVQMRCWTPSEWIDQGAPVDLGAPCSITASTPDEELELGEPLALAACTAPPEALPRAPTSHNGECRSRLCESHES